MTYPYLFSSSLTLLTVRVGLSVMHSLPISFLLNHDCVDFRKDEGGRDVYSHNQTRFPPSSYSFIHEILTTPICRRLCLIISLPSFAPTPQGAT